jgi:hypothetical protein
MLPHGESACAPLPDFLALRPMMRGMIAALLAVAKPQKVKRGAMVLGVVRLARIAHSRG